MTPYPTAVDFAEASKVVAERLIAGVGTNAHCAHSGWVVLGYVGSIVLPCDDRTPPVASGAHGPCTTPQEVAQFLLEVSSVRGEPVGAFPWVQILTILGPIILEWWKNR